MSKGCLIVSVLAVSMLSFVTVGSQYTKDRIYTGEVRLQAKDVLNSDGALCGTKRLIVSKDDNGHAYHLYAENGELKTVRVSYRRLMVPMGDNQYEVYLSAALDEDKYIAGIKDMSKRDVKNAIKKALYVPVKYHCVS